MSNVLQRMVAHRPKKSSSHPTLRRERQLWRAGYSVVAGVDEVGRGAWAGPLVAAAVAVRRQDAATLVRQSWWLLVRDSKLLAPSLRAELAQLARAHLTFAIAVVPPTFIDRVGVGEANRRAVHQAVRQLSPRPDFVLTDYVAGLGARVAGVPARGLVRGDATLCSVALASIIAKVERDRIMSALDKRYPGYAFAQHKGYGTPQHRAALFRLGPSPAHRRSYRPVGRALVY